MASLDPTLGFCNGLQWSGVSGKTTLDIVRTAHYNTIYDEYITILSDNICNKFESMLLNENIEDTSFESTFQTDTTKATSTPVTSMDPAFRRNEMESSGITFTPKRQTTNSRNTSFKFSKNVHNPNASFTLTNSQPIMNFRGHPKVRRSIRL